MQRFKIPEKGIYGTNSKSLAKPGTQDQCPLTAQLATPVIEAIKQAIPWNSYSTDQKAAVLLGSIPHTLKTKHVAMWSKTYSPQIIELAASIHAATKQAQSNKP